MGKLQIFGLALLAQLLVMLAVTGLEYFYPAKTRKPAGRIRNIGVGAVLLALRWRPLRGLAL
ncbi:MAG TPA: hypothetical protein VIJ85_00905 [Rhizomicrobium sp.]